MPRTIDKRLLAAGFTGALAIAAAFIVPFEGVQNVPYFDPPGIPTVCIGHTGGVVMGETKTDQECVAIFKQDLMSKSADIERLVKVKLPPETLAAVLSFTFNAGAGNLAKSTLLKKLNKGDIRGACLELDKWTYSGGVKLAGLVKRRAAERELCLKGVK